jgi:hypothetical protein
MDSSDRLPKHLLIAFGLALGIYVVFFVGDGWTRTRKGPWEVSFTTNLAGEASIVVNQRALGIADVRITFEGERITNGPATLRFARPGQTVPFGRTKFEDLTYLPGSVAFDFFGHEVELLPRTLYLNKQEHAWVSGTNHVLSAEEKLPPEMSYDPRKKKRSLFRR